MRTRAAAELAAGFSALARPRWRLVGETRRRGPLVRDGAAARADVPRGERCARSAGAPGMRCSCRTPGCGATGPRAGALQGPPMRSANLRRAVPAAAPAPWRSVRELTRHPAPATTVSTGTRGRRQARVTRATPGRDLRRRGLSETCSTLGGARSRSWPHRRDRLLAVLRDASGNAGTAQRAPPRWAYKPACGALARRPGGGVIRDGTVEFSALRYQHLRTPLSLTQ